MASVRQRERLGRLALVKWVQGIGDVVLGSFSRISMSRLGVKGLISNFDEESWNETKASSDIEFI